MANEKKIKLNTLSQESKKKKDFLIFAGIFAVLGLVVFSLFTFTLSVDKKKVFEKRENAELKKKELKIAPKQTLKEAWAISVENTFKEQNKMIMQFMKDMQQSRKEDQEEVLSMIEELKKEQEGEFIKMRESMDKKMRKLEKKVQEQLMRQNNKIEELRLAKSTTVVAPTAVNPDEDIILGEDLLPKITPEKKELIEKQKELEALAKQEENATKADNTLNNGAKAGGPGIVNVEESNGSIVEEPKVKPKKKFSFFKIDTKAAKNYQLQQKKLELAQLKKKLKQKNTYHIMTGFTKAYLVTGVYAPAFSEGKTDPLPVLLQAEGDILVPNNHTESVKGCFFIGAAKGNMNSQTADIRISKISCVLEGGKKIEGNVQGWVIGENGIPGVPGELLHKNGAWLAKTFVAGFLETFSDVLVNYAGNVKGSGDGGDNINIGGEAAGAAAESTSDLFQRLGDYYLKMAEQIFPVIEIKPGRVVDILLKGGDTLTVTDYNSANIDQMEAEIKAMEAEKEQAVDRINAMKESVSLSNAPTKDFSAPVGNNGANKSIPVGVGDSGPKKSPETVTEEDLFK